MLRKTVAIILLAFLSSACAAQHTAFISEPPGANVVVDGYQIGVTPCQFDYNLSPGDSHKVVISKEGYEPLHFVVKTDEVDTKARNKWLAAGVVWSPLWIGTFFTKKLKDTYDFMLRENAPSMTADAGRPTVPSESAL